VSKKRASRSRKQKKKKRGEEEEEEEEATISKSNCLCSSLSLSLSLSRARISHEPKQKNKRTVIPSAGFFCKSLICFTMAFTVAVDKCSIFLLLLPLSLSIFPHESKLLRVKKTLSTIIRSYKKCAQRVQTMMSSARRRGALSLNVRARSVRYFCPIKRLRKAAPGCTLPNLFCGFPPGLLLLETKKKSR